MTQNSLPAPALGSSLLAVVRGTVRLTIMVPLFVIAAVFVLVLYLVPVNVGGARLSMWPVVFLARALLPLFGVEITCSDRARIRQHHGLIFPNHISYADIVVLLAIAPVRFLSKASVRSWPVVGVLAAGIDTVFVARKDKDSRRAARGKLIEVLQTRAYPPVVLFAEGGTGPGHAVLPLRYGAFETAMAAQVPYLVCAIAYDQPAVVKSYKEPMKQALWRVATNGYTVHVTVTPLSTVLAAVDDDPQRLAEQAHQELSATVVRHGGLLR